MLRGFPQIFTAVYWLFLLHVVLAAAVGGFDTSIHFDHTLLQGVSGLHTGSGHCTNISGGTSTHSFTGEFGQTGRC